MADAGISNGALNYATISHSANIEIPNPILVSDGHYVDLRRPFPSRLWFGFSCSDFCKESRSDSMASDADDRFLASIVHDWTPSNYTRAIPSLCCLSALRRADGNS